MGIMDLFTYKSPRQRAKEKKRYAQWAFPYGESQRQQIVRLLEELMPKEPAEIALATYLIGREAYGGSWDMEPEEQVERTEQERLAAAAQTLANHLRGNSRKYLPYYLALILADAGIGADLQYPTAEQLRERAQSL